MKFTNGMWMTREGCEISFPKESHTVNISENSLTIYAPYTKVIHRGNTTDGGLMTIKISSPAADIISVSMKNHMGGRGKQARFTLDSQEADVRTYETDLHYVLSSGNVEARVNKTGGWGISFYRGGRLLTSTSGKSMAHMTDPDKKTFMRERLELDVGENIYGLGERFTAFVKNGQSVDTWNEDGGTDSEQAYKSIPFYVSTRNYGVFVNSTDNVSFEIASESVTKAQFSVPGESMEYFIIGGESLKHVISSYCALTGRPSLPPAWSFGLWLTTSFTTDYSEETVMHFIDGMLDRGIPLSAFHFDCFWMKDFEWTSFMWDPENFPDPAGLISQIHAKGVKVCVWINPYIAQKSPLFQEGFDNNYFVNTGKGDVWQWDRWQAGMALVDFTNPRAKEWYQKYLDGLVEMGVDAFKTDFGERIPTTDPFFGRKSSGEGISYHNGMSPDSMHNYYTYLYNQAVFDVLERRLGKNQACLFARSATVGGQKFPVHWGGDCLSTYPSMAESLRGGLSLSLCGFGFWSHDIGGFEAGCTPDIYKRWTQFGLLSSHSRYHGNSEYKVPWLYGEEAVDVTRFFTRLKLRLMPYLFAAAVEASIDGIPMMRPMLLEFPEDETCQHLDRQYMLGFSLLCAPIFNKDGMARYYAPAGNWTNILTREKIQGPRWCTEKHDYFTFPLLARENSIIITGKTDDVPEYDYPDSVTINIYELTEKEETSAEIYSAEGLRAATVRAQLEKGRITIDTKGLTGPFRILLMNRFDVESSSAGDPQKTESGTMIECGTQIECAGTRIEIELFKK